MFEKLSLVITSILISCISKEIKIIKFRETLCSIRVTKASRFTPFFDCQHLNVKIEASFNEKEPWVIKMSCSENYARVDISFEDYTESNKVYEENIDFKATIQQGSTRFIEDLINIVENKIMIQPGKVKKLQKTEGFYTLQIDIIYRCQGYDGYNCNIDSPEHPFYKTDPINKISYCIDETGENCDDLKCSKSDSKRCVNGECYVQTFGKREEYCICSPPYYGDLCQYTALKPELEEEILLFGEQIDIGIAIRSNECEEKCKKCEKYEKFNVCKELKDMNFKYECIEALCDETCGKTICRMKDGESDEIYYYKTLSKANSGLKL